MYTPFSPIVLFVYNRLYHTKQVVEALKNNALARDSELFIYADAAKNHKFIDQVKEVRNYIKTIDGFKKINIIERETNFGLANSIIEGVTTVVNEFGRVIVLEDDLVTSPYFLNFMNDSLNLYRGKQNVWGVGAYMHPVEINNVETLFLPYTTSWGWATWNDRWKYFEREPDSLKNLLTKKEINRFDLDGVEDLWSQVIKNSNGSIFTWAIFWYATVFLNNGCCVYPYKSLVKNIGFDGSGEHCRPTDKYDIDLLDSPINNFDMNIKVNTKVFVMVKKYLKCRQNFVVRTLKRAYFFRR